MVQQGGKPYLLIAACDSPHALQLDRHTLPALGPVCGQTEGVPLGRSHSLHGLRQRWCSAFVRPLPRYYGSVRPPISVHVGIVVVLLQTSQVITPGSRWGLPVLV